MYTAAMDVFITRYCLSLVLFTLATSAGSNEANNDEPREPRVSGRIVKLYSGPKPEPYICPGEGFQPDYNNCAVFYRCIKEKSGKFTVFRYQCAPGTVYDPDLETCNHPRSTRRSECGGMVKPTAEPPRPTNVHNINEIDGAQSEVPRPISTKVPIYTEQATVKIPTTQSWILSTERQNNYTQVPWQSTSINTGYPWSSTFTNTMTTSPPQTTHQSNSKNSDPCTSDGFMGDNENCRKFYRCVGNQRGGFIKYEFSCSELTVWDDEIQGCNHPWAVKRSKCGRSLSYVDKSETATTPTAIYSSSTTKEPNMNNGGYGYKSNKTVQHQLQVSHGPQVTQIQTQISNSNEVIQNQTQIHYGEKLQNSKTSKSGTKQNQSQISYGTAVSQTQTQIDYGNKGIQTQLQIDHSKNSGQSQIQIQDTTTVQSTTKPQNNNGNGKCSESGFVGDAKDCKKFYRCVDNGRGTYTKYEYTCGDGTVWDPEIEACNHAWAVKHCGGKLPPDTTSGYTTTNMTTEYSTEDTKTTHIYHTTSAIPDIDDEDDIGYGNQNNQEITQSSSTTLKPTTTSVISTSTTTEQSNEAVTECKSSGFIGDKNNCKLFYRCVDNGRGGFIKYEFKCGDGTLWDQDIEACNHAWAVKKCGGTSSGNVDKEESTTQKDNSTPSQQVQTTVTLTQITSQAPPQTDDYDTGYGSQSNEPSTTTVRTTKQPQEQYESNECKSSGFMGDHNDCKKFYRCVDNGNGGYTRYEFSCGENTVWDPKIEACNHAWAVDKCGGSNNANEIIKTTSLSPPTTNYDQGSSSQTTQAIKDTDTPVFTSTTTTKSTTVTSVSTSKCTKSGFVGDDADCKKFYRCVDKGDGSYTRFEFTCGEGTVWDPEIEACNHAWAVKTCGGSSIPTHATQQTTSQHTVIQDEEQENGYVSPIYDSSENPQTTTTLKSSSTTSATSSETNKCNNSGFMGDKNNCKKFYRCVDNGKGGYDRYEFQCGEGTVWDSSIEACNHAWAVKDCRASGSSSTQTENESTTQSASNGPSVDETQQSTEKPSSTTEHQDENEIISDQCVQEGFFGNQQDCKKFYRCVDNGKGGYTKYDFTCGEGTSWNPEIQGCDHANPNRPCNTKPSQEPIYVNDDMDSPTTTITTTKTTTTSDEKESTKPTKKPESSGTCESDGFYGNPSDCKKFYRCVDNGNGGYTKYDFNCGQGTVWNQEIQACDHESADKTCISSSPVSESTTNPSKTTTSSYTTTKKQETTDKTASTENTGNGCTSEGFFAHSNDCKKFIRCVDNGKGGYTRYEFSCGDGTVWVQEIQACDHDNGDIICRPQNESTFKPQQTGAQSSDTTVSNMMSSTESMTPSREDDEYDNDTPKEPSQNWCTSEGYFANKEDCRKFYRCVDNGNGGYTKYDFVCGDGTAWDQSLQTCNHINEVESCNDNNQQGSENHYATTSTNDAETESTSSTTKTTPSDSSSSSSNSQDKCENEGYYGDSKDCKKFYRCVDNGKGGYTKYDFTCGDGTIWDQDITNCNHPQDVSNPSCGTTQESGDTSSTTSTTTSSPSQTTSATNESSSSSSSNQTTSDCSQESSKKPANDKVTCDKAGYYSNPNDCKKFYRCVDWDGDGKRFSVFHFECGEGTIWDPALDTCNHEDSVYPQRDCSQTQSQNVSESTSTEGTTSSLTTESTTSEQSTQETTTSQKTTTQESTTNEQTTTQQSTTSEETTTQQLTTKETPTTQESTTTEQTTTQQATTSEKTTTQEPTTSEQTTTEQTTTSDKTTTQEQTTSEQTTTEQITTSQLTTQEQTTSEQTTTEKTTTSEYTTTEQSTTSEKTTTEESATTEQTTTQESTTKEQTTTEKTTTQESTISEPTTTEESTASEQTTTQESTTSEQTTTQESTTSEQTTTQESTTNEQTTQQSTTTEQTTTEQSNEQTTEESSTTESTTEGTTTTEDSTDQTTTESDSTESTESSSTTEETSSSGKECPETDDDQYLLVCPTSFRRHPKYCNMFYQCTEDDENYEAKVAMFKCPNNTIYDESQTQCVTEDKADKECEGEIANRRRFKRLGSHYKDPIVADKGKLSCSTEGFFSFEKKSECAKGFLKCAKNINGVLKGHVYQCPEGYIYWSISKRCERLESVRDCKKSSNDWTGRWNIPVERKNIAAS